MIDVCELIRDELKRQNRPKCWLADKIKHDRSSLCKMLNNHNYLPSSLIHKISMALNHDFFMDLSDGLNGKKKQTETD